MSSSTWTPRAVASNTIKASARLWRAVEAQHVASTRKLVDSLEEQRALEEILEATKPPVPAVALKLDYLLFTPFRYPALRPSRFRGIPDPGVFYGAESVRTACAELGYWRWRFLAESEGLSMLGPAQQTLFEVAVRSTTADLERKPYVRDAKIWRHPEDYSCTQMFARAARTAGVGLIRYGSVRDPAGGRCGAVMHPGAFASPRPVSPTQTWLLTVTPSHAIWQRGRDAFEFDMRVWKKAVA